MTVTSASLVIPSYRGEARLGRLLDALRSQTFVGEWEAIVVIDGIVDDSVALLDAVDDLPIRRVVLPENRGRSAALNAGFAEARGDVLIRCDDDLEPGSNHVERHVRAHQHETSVGVVGLYRNVYGESSYAQAYGRRYDRQVRDGAYGGSLGEPWLFWAGNCSVTRSVYDSTGPYDEAFRAYGWEDIDWGYRLVSSGVPIVLDPGLEVVHHAAIDDASTKLSRAYASGVARSSFDAKHDLRYRQDPGVGAKAKAWHFGVRGLSRLGGPERFVRLGRGIDTLLGRLSPSVGYRLVAFGADAAALAGHRRAELERDATVHERTGDRR